MGSAAGRGLLYRGEHGCPQGTEDPDRTCQTSRRAGSVRRVAPPPPGPPGWHSSHVKHSHKSWLPPRPALGPPKAPGDSPLTGNGPAPEWWGSPSGLPTMHWVPQKRPQLPHPPRPPARRTLCYCFLQDPAEELLSSPCWGKGFSGCIPPTQGSQLHVPHSPAQRELCVE